MSDAAFYYEWTLYISQTYIAAQAWILVVAIFVRDPNRQGVLSKFDLSTYIYIYIYIYIYSARALSATATRRVTASTV